MKWPWKRQPEAPGVDDLLRQVESLRTERDAAKAELAALEAQMGGLAEAVRADIEKRSEMLRFTHAMRAGFLNGIAASVAAHARPRRGETPRGERAR